MTQKFYHVDKFFCHHQIFFFLKKTFKAALQYLFNIFKLITIVFNLKLNFKLNLDQKMRTFKNLEKILKKRVETLNLVYIPVLLKLLF